MLEIKHCEEKKTIALYCKKCGRILDDSFYLYLARDKSGQLAACLFEVGGESVSAIYYECIDENDYWLFDGILRAGFNYAFEQGINTGVIPERFRVTHKSLFDRLNYPVSQSFDITNFFKKYKNCKQEM